MSLRSIVRLCTIMSVWVGLWVQVVIQTTFEWEGARTNLWEVLSKNWWEVLWMWFRVYLVGLHFKDLMNQVSQSHNKCHTLTKTHIIYYNVSQKPSFTASTLFYMRMFAIWNALEGRVWCNVWFVKLACLCLHLTVFLIWSDFPVGTNHSKREKKERT